VSRWPPAQQGAGGLGKRRLFGIDRSGPPPEATLSGHPLNPWTVPNAIGFARLAGIPAFLIVALSSRGGHDALAAVLFAAIGWVTTSMASPPA